MRNTLLFLAVWATSVWASGAHAVDCPATNYNLNSQAEVDSFPGGCDRVRRDLVIRGADITDLTPLSGLTSIGRDLRIRDNNSLASLAPLGSVADVGRNLLLLNNDQLTDLSGLGGLGSLGGYLQVRGNAALVDLDALAGVSGVGGNLQLRDNPALTSLAGLAGITAVGGYLQVYNNDALTDLGGLHGLASLGGNLYIANNALLADVDALQGLTAVPGYLRLDNNPALASVTGLAAVASVGNYLRIRNNDALIDLAGLAVLTRVVNNVTIDRNGALADCSGVIPLLDGIDDGDPGPGPNTGTPPTGGEVAPDVGGFIFVRRNVSPACNSVAEILGAAVPPMFSQAVSPETAAIVGGVATSTVTFTIDNSGGTARATALDFVDTLPAGLVVAAAPNPISSCEGGTLTADGGAGVIAYTGGTVQGGASCTLQVDVAAAAPGLYVNTTGDLTSSAGNSGPATASLTVVQRSYTGPLPGGGTGSLSFTTTDPGCGFAGSPQFLSGDGVTPAPPGGIRLIDGLVQFAIDNCAPGAVVQVTMDYGAPLPSGSGYWQVADPWRQLAAVISGSAAQFELVDGGAGDEDGTQNGRIAGGRSGAAQPVAVAGPVPVPIDQAPMLLLTCIGLLLAAGLARSSSRR